MKFIVLSSSAIPETLAVDLNSRVIGGSSTPLSLDDPYRYTLDQIAKGRTGHVFDCTNGRSAKASKDMVELAGDALLGR